MDKKTQLKEINTELKIYVNEASFVSNSCRNKLIRYLGDAFDIKLPIENFAKIDVSLLEDGSIEMRDEVYQREDSLSFDEVLERYHTFKEKADNLLKRKSKDSFPLNDSSNIKNLFVVLLLSVLFIALFILLDPFWPEIIFIVFGYFFLFLLGWYLVLERGLFRHFIILKENLNSFLQQLFGCCFLF